MMKKVKIVSETINVNPISLEMDLHATERLDAEIEAVGQSVLRCLSEDGYKPVIKSMIITPILQGGDECSYTCGLNVILLIEHDEIIP